ncbi:MAG TPA: HAD family hydrolase [Dehalococcoidia bacterium]|jgi:putative hydrolase of the HAD superfamily
MASPRVVLFDIGSTLWSSPAEDAQALQLCYGRAREALLQEMPDAPAIEALIDTVEHYFAEWEDVWRTDAGNVRQPPTTEYVATALRKLNLSPSPATLARFTEELLETSVFTAKVEPPEPGMSEALAQLKGLGVRLACVSNAFMGAATLTRIMDGRGLGEHLELTVSSCEFGWRKPHASIYQEAARLLGVEAPDSVFVGDRLDADVAGPAALGMRTVLTHQYRQEDAAKAPVQPDAVIKHLSELPDVIEAMLRRAGRPD